MTGSELFIVDNSDNDWKVIRYLSDFCPISEQIHIATGYFEIGALLALDGKWQAVDKIRILMGDEVSKRTARTIGEAFQKITGQLDASLEAEKIKNDFLDGVAAIVEGLASGKIECRIFQQGKFHAKAYITHSRLEVVGSAALVGSSNFTKPGLTENIELNVQIRGAEVRLLQQWYEDHWQRAEDCTADILKVIDRHARDYQPFDVWLKAISEYLKGHETSVDEWEAQQSAIYPLLGKYQQDGYHAVLKRAEKYGGGFLCDGVGLGKTFVGLMLIERFLMFKGNRRNVALFVPKAAREAVWERELNKHLPQVLDGFLPFRIFNHTDLHRQTFERSFQSVKSEADVIIIDEAHHFRNRGRRSLDDPAKRSRYFRMLELTAGKQVFLLTATPVNNGLLDLKHLIDLFAQEDDQHFAKTLGIFSLNGHFKTLEEQLDREADLREGTKGRADTTNIGRHLDMSLTPEMREQSQLFKELVVQRSRKYVKDSLSIAHQGQLLFPTRSKPKIADYSVRETYGDLLNKIEAAFNKHNPLFILSIYNPYMHYIGTEDERDPLAVGRQTQVVALIRLGFLKRFESSAQAFEMSCRTLMYKLLAWIEVHSDKTEQKERLDRWRQKNSQITAYITEIQFELFGDNADIPEEDIIPAEFLDAATDKMLDPSEFDIQKLLADAYEDLDQLVEFLRETKKVTAAKDDKLKSLKKLLKKDKVLKQHKVLIFSEFKATARYLYKQLKEDGIEDVGVIDSSTKENRASLVQRFAPYYNDSSSMRLADEGRAEIRVLISTDVLAEGLNLQDCTRLINYDIHWNPVRLMQRIGRIDRRMNPEIEARILAAHPRTRSIRGTAAYWNFLPPGELDRLLRLHKRVAGKTLRISKVLGVEGGKLLKPDDNYDDLRDFDERYEGQTSLDETLHLEFQKMLAGRPELESRIRAYPGKLFSGKASPQAGVAGVFFCYALPTPRTGAEDEILDFEAQRWSCDEGNAQWYFIDAETGKLCVDQNRIARLIRSTEVTNRVCTTSQAELIRMRQQVEREIKNGYLCRMNAPAGVKPELRCWMEVV